MICCIEVELLECLVFADSDGAGLRAKMFALRNYLGYNERVVIVPDMPEECPEVE
ncbi:MAG: hypothetical protein ACLU4N_07025 [Butyricimonas faecihominis]